MTCNNYESVYRSFACIAGCECPGGGVINEETNSCVALEDCPNGEFLWWHCDTGSHDLVAARQGCPAVTSPAPCVIECNSDDDCGGNLSCCFNGCGRVCTEQVQCAVSQLVSVQ